MHAVAGAGPNPPLGVDAEAVEQTRRAFREHLAAGKRRAVGADLETADVARPVHLMRDAGVGDIEQALVRREGEAVRPHHVGDDGRDLARARIDAIDVAAADLRRLPVALVIGVDAIGGIGEPDRAVRLHDDVVGGVEPLALIAVGEHHDAAVPMGHGDAARQMLAGDQPALVVDGVAVGIVRALAEHRDLMAGLGEPHHAVVGDVGPDEVAPGGEPGRPLAPARARPQPLDAHMARVKLAEPPVVGNKSRPFDFTVIHRVLPFWGGMLGALACGGKRARRGSGAGLDCEPKRTSRLYLSVKAKPSPTGRGKRRIKTVRNPPPCRYRRCWLPGRL